MKTRLLHCGSPSIDSGDIIHLVVAGRCFLEVNLLFSLVWTHECGFHHHRLPKSTNVRILSHTPLESRPSCVVSATSMSLSSIYEAPSSSQLRLSHSPARSSRLPICHDNIARRLHSRSLHKDCEKAQAHATAGFKSSQVKSLHYVTFLAIAKGISPPGLPRFHSDASFGSLDPHHLSHDLTIAMEFYANLLMLPPELSESP